MSASQDLAVGQDDTAAKNGSEHGPEVAESPPEPIGEQQAVDVEDLPDLVDPAEELDLRGYLGIRRFLTAAARWGILAVLAGAVAGAGAALFIFGLDALIHGIDDARAALPWWTIALFPAVGGTLVGYLLWRTDRVAFVSACGTDSFIDAVEEVDGRIPARVPVVRVLGAWLTIGFGGSSGRECPMIYTGAGLGSTTGLVLERARARAPRWLAGVFDLSKADTRLLALCGAAGALGAVFSAPVGGAFFAVEVPYRRDIDVGVFWPALVSSFTGFAVGHLIVGRQRLLHLPLIGHLSSAEWVLVGAIAVAGSLVARLFAVAFNGFHAFVRRTFREDRSVPKWLQTGIGGIGAGLIMLAFPQVYGIGIGAIRDIASGRLFTGHAAATAALLFAGLGLAKIAASTFTVGSGGVGGLLFPSMFVGASLGGVATSIARAIDPSAFPHGAAYVLIAMSATYAAAGKVPIASMLLLVEATVSAALVVPMAAANGVAYLLSGRSTVYDVQRERATANQRRGYPLALAVAGIAVLAFRLWGVL